MYNMLKYLLYTIIASVVCMSAALGQTETLNDATLSPYFLIENGDPAIDRFPLKDTRVAVNINGVIAAVMITQKYANDGSQNRPGGPGDIQW